MLIVLQIGLLIYGIATLASAELTLGGRHAARGVPAYFAGLLFMVPLPLALTIGAMLGVANPAMFNGANDSLILLALAEWVLTLGCLGLVMGVAYANSTEGKSEYRRPRRRRDEPGEDDAAPPDRDEGRISNTPRPSRPPARFDEDDDDDRPPRRRRSSEDDY